ncbi:MAG TPA: UDP-N-acetylmuramate dehydrogenase [Thermomicrobiales bacterium]|nr:UDP-N-acetylmuramate dehydrogenase [Thermomicrobiales bacterium]
MGSAKPLAAEVAPPRDLRLLRDEPVARYTSFRVGGPADYLARPANLDELRAALVWAAGAGLPVRLIGGGSNLLVADRGVRGLAIVYHHERQEIVAEETGDAVRVTAPAQVGLSKLGRHCCERGWAGLDWAVGLPGTVGGAVANNAGAHGTEMIDNLEGVTVLTPGGELATHPAAWLEARYRHTIIRSPDPAERPPGIAVVAATLRLRRGDRAALLALADEHAAWRKANQPRKPCAGSIFKNPPGSYAGLLIEEVGLKGYRVGGAQISPQHANFIVNVGGATGADVLALIREAQRIVLEARGIALETEVEFVGDWSEVDS